MSNANPWVTGGIGVAGILATLTAGVLGYRSGEEAVSEDYVGFAITTLQKDDASPELRKWSVDVLAEFSPIPFGDEVREELESPAVYINRYIVPRWDMPVNFMEPCPNLLDDEAKFKAATSGEGLFRLMEEYEGCRLRLEALASSVARIGEAAKKLQKKLDETSAEAAK